MKSGSGGAIVGIGMLSVAVAVISRLTKQPVAGIEAEAINQFAQTCFLLAIALACKGACETKK